MERFAKLPKWGQYLAVLIVAGVLIFALWYLLILDQRATGNSLDQKLDQLASDIRQGKEALKALNALNREMDTILGDLEVYKSIIPLDPQTGTLLRAFQGFARDQNLEITKISPAVLSKQELYTQQPYNINVTGGYHDVALFFDKLAHMRRIVNVSGLELSGVQRKNQFALNAKFDAMVYMQNPENLDAPSGSPEKPKEKKP